MANERIKKLDIDALEAVTGGVNIDTVDMDYCWTVVNNYARRHYDIYHDELDKFDIAQSQYLAYVSSLGDDVPVPKFSTYLQTNGYGYWFA